MPSGTFVATNNKVVIGGVDLTDEVESVEVDDEFDEVDFTNMGSGGNQSLKAGLGKGQVTILFQQNYDAAKVDETLWAARGTLATIAARPEDAAISSTNPEYSASYLISKYKPVNGKVGDKAGMTLTFKRSGALTRDVTP